LAEKNPKVGLTLGSASFNIRPFCYLIRVEHKKFQIMTVRNFVIWSKIVKMGLFFLKSMNIGNGVYMTLTHSLRTPGYQEDLSKNSEILPDYYIFEQQHKKSI
jgi:hypothetical protein